MYNMLGKYHKNCKEKRTTTEKHQNAVILTLLLYILDVAFCYTFSVFRSLAYVGLYDNSRKIKKECCRNRCWMLPNSASYLLLLVTNPINTGTAIFKLLYFLLMFNFRLSNIINISFPREPREWHVYMAASYERRYNFSCCCLFFMNSINFTGLFMTSSV